MSETEYPRVLDASVLSEEAQKLEARLLRKIIGQDRAVHQFVKVYQQIEVGLNKPNRPAGVFLFLGPTGTGKTQLVRAAAEAVLDKPDAITRVDCGEYQADHEVSKLIGSPPGYVGFANKDAIRLSQEKIDKFQTSKHKINFVLFDEIEDAANALHAAIVQILDAGRLTLGTGDEVDFSKTIVVLTSNLGEKEVQTLLQGGGIGLQAPTGSERTLMDSEIYKVAKNAATKRFKPKFMNRIDKIMVFRSLSDETLRKILKIEVLDLENRIWGSAFRKWQASGDGPPIPQSRIAIRTTAAADNFIIKEGTSVVYGARELNRAVERFIGQPLGALMGSKQIGDGDVVEVDHEPEAKKLTFRIIELHHRLYCES